MACAFFMNFTDERDAIQKKTFTKWVNKHLSKVNYQMYFIEPWIIWLFRKECSYLGSSGSSGAHECMYAALIKSISLLIY